MPLGGRGDERLGEGGGGDAAIFNDVHDIHTHPSTGTHPLTRLHQSTVPSSCSAGIKDPGINKDPTISSYIKENVPRITVWGRCQGALLEIFPQTAKTSGIRPTVFLTEVNRASPTYTKK